MNDIAYSAKKVDLFYPARNGHFFSPSVRGAEAALNLPDTEAGLCAEMARLVYCRQEPDFFFDKRQISQVLKDVGFTSCQFFESKGTADGMGTHCLLAVHDDSDAAKRLAVVAFRGTDSSDPTDLLDDIEVVQTEWKAGGRVHVGFSRSLSDVQNDLLQALELISCRVLFAGHSLGAAMATLLASLRKPDHLYTFGSPRVGNDLFVDALNGVNTSRFVDCCDIVARVPPATVPFNPNYTYEHFGTPCYIGQNRQVTPNPPEGFMRDDRLHASEEYILNYGWVTGNVGLRELADHAPINYVTAVGADSSQPKLGKWRVATDLGKSG